MELGNGNFVDLLLILVTAMVTCPGVIGAPWNVILDILHISPKAHVTLLVGSRIFTFVLGFKMDCKHITHVTYLVSCWSHDLIYKKGSPYFPFHNEENICNSKCYMWCLWHRFQFVIWGTKEGFLKTLITLNQLQ